MAFALNRALDRDALNGNFSRDGYVHIPAILEPGCAALTCAAMQQDTPWNLVFRDRGRHVDLAAENVTALTPDQTTRLSSAIYAQARNDFQYCYNNYPIYDLNCAGKGEGHLLDTFYGWINSDVFLDFCRGVTGLSAISYADAQATRFMPGHFLKQHDDQADGKHRLAAFVFNFTRDWQPDWGGFLQLLDSDGNVRRGLMPTFNSLNLLAVPQSHNVSLVAPFALAPRYAVTGWLRGTDAAA